MATVLLGGGGTGTAFAIASRLRASWGAALRLVVTDINDAHLVTTALLADAFRRVPPANDPAFVDRLAEIVRADRIDTYIPILNDEIVAAYRLSRAAEFRDVDFWSSATHARLVDKCAADDWLRAAGVPTPERREAAAAGTWFAKPRDGFGSRGARAMTGAELDELPAGERDRLLVQELCAPPEVTVDSFHDAATDRTFAYCRERIEVKAGVCTKARLFADEGLSDVARRIGRALGQRGTICFQVMRGADGWCVTDLNLRSGAGTALTCAAGFDVLSAAYACRAGQDYVKFLGSGPEADVYVTRQYAEFVMGAPG